MRAIEHIWKGVAMRNNLMRLVIVTLFMSIGSSLSEGQSRDGKLGVGLSGSYFIFDSDFSKTDLSGGVSMDVVYSLSDHLSLRGAVGINQLQAKGTPYPTLLTTYVHGSLALGVSLMPHQPVNPFLYAGGSAFYFDPRTGGRTALPGVNSGSGLGNTLIAGGGVEFHLNEFFAITVAAEAALPTTDRLDGVLKDSNDKFYGVSFGIRYYVFDAKFVRRMLKAYEDRSSR